MFLKLMITKTTIDLAWEPELPCLQHEIIGFDNALIKNLSRQNICIKRKTLQTKKQV